jgi:hypothetical protein
VERRRKIKDLDRPNIGDRVMTVGMVMIPNKFRLCAVLMFKTVIAMPTVITLRNIESSGYNDCSTKMALLHNQYLPKSIRRRIICKFLLLEYY